jgi:hypothetical protein
MLLLSLALLGIAGSANADHWKVIYDWEPGSTNTTINPGGTFVEDILGKIEVQYDAVSSGAPITGARFVGGNSSGFINQPAGVLTVTGFNNRVFSPAPNGTPGAFSGLKVTFPAILPTSLTGFLHCYGGAACTGFFGTPSSTPIPSNTIGAFTFNAFTFAATAGVGDFVSPTITSFPQASVTTMTKYVGREISRVWVGNVPSMGIAGSGVLVAGMLLSGLNSARRKR